MGWEDFKEDFNGQLYILSALCSEACLTLVTCVGGDCEETQALVQALESYVETVHLTGYLNFDGYF